MLVDLPIPELFNFTGRNPRPADFDLYWERALGELAALETRPELIPAAFGCLHQFANPSKIAGEKGAWERAAVKKYAEN